MKKIYVLQDIRTKEYYWNFWMNEGFDININEAKKFNNTNEAEKIIQMCTNERNKDLFTDRFELFVNRLLEIKCYYKLS